MEGNIPVLFQGICRKVAPTLLEQSLAGNVRHIPTEIEILVGLNLTVHLSTPSPTESVFGYGIYEITRCYLE